MKTVKEKVGQKGNCSVEEKGHEVGCLDGFVNGCDEG